MSSAVAKHYAQALFEVASKLNQVDEVESNLSDVTNVLKSEEEFASFLVHPLLDASKKKSVLQNVFGGRISTTALNVLYVLIDNDRADLIASLSDEFTRLANEAKGIVEAEVKSAQLLTQEQLNEVAGQFSKLTGKTVNVNPVVDPSLLGGIVVRIGDRVYDGSVKSKLERFSRSFNAS